MAWKDITPYLDRFTKLKAPQKAIKKDLIHIVKKTLHIALKEDEIVVQKNTILLNTNPAIKNEIFLNKGKILGELKRTLSGKDITDIR